jgi:hypothetical protein
VTYSSTSLTEWRHLSNYLPLCRALPVHCELCCGWSGTSWQVEGTSWSLCLDRYASKMVSLLVCRTQNVVRYVLCVCSKTSVSSSVYGLVHCIPSQRASVKGLYSYDMFSLCFGLYVFEGVPVTLILNTILSSQRPFVVRVLYQLEYLPTSGMSRLLDSVIYSKDRKSFAIYLST